MKHLVTFRALNESENSVEAGVSFDCLSVEKTARGHDIQIVAHDYFYEGKDFISLLQNMMEEKEHTVAKGFSYAPSMADDLQIDIGGAVKSAVKSVYGTDAFDDIRKVVKAKNLIDFEDGKEDFEKVIAIMETKIGAQLSSNNRQIKERIKKNILSFESQIDVGYGDI
jgi:hypothetical protein